MAETLFQLALEAVFEFVFAAVTGNFRSGKPAPTRARATRPPPAAF